jgi:hypothetical protein
MGDELYISKTRFRAKMKRPSIPLKALKDFPKLGLFQRDYSEKKR